MKTKTLTAIMLVVSFLAACGGYSAYKWAIQSELASEGRLVQLSVANNDEFYRIQTDYYDNDVYTAKINKAGEILKEQAFQTTGYGWHKILSANAGHYFLYSEPSRYPIEPPRLAYVDVENGVMNENFDLSAAFEGAEFLPHASTVNARNELILVGSLVLPGDDVRWEGLIIVVDGAGNIIHRHRDPLYRGFYRVAAFGNNTFAVSAINSEITESSYGKILRFDGQYQQIQEIPVVVPSASWGITVRAITDRGVYLGMRTENGPVVNLRLLDWNANERFSVQVDENHIYNLFSTAFFHEFNDGSFVLGRPDVVEKFDAAGQSIFRHIPMGKYNYTRKIFVGPNDDLFIGYRKGGASYGTTVKTETDADGNTTSRIVVLMSGSTTVGYEQIAANGTRVRTVTEQPFKYQAEADHLPPVADGGDLTGVFEVISVQPGPCEIEDAVVMPDGMLISHSKLCEAEDFEGDAAPYRYTTRAY